MDNLGSINNDTIESEDHFVDDSENKELVNGSSSNIKDPMTIKDHYRIVYILFYFYGVATLMPWTFFITATEYWMYKFRDVSPHNYSIPLGKTRFQADFTSYLNVASSSSTTIFLILNTIYGSRFSMKLRIMGSLIIITTLFILTTAFVQINTDDWQNAFFIITMTIVFIMNGAGAIFSSTLFGIVGKFPSKYMTAVVSGQALGGIIAAVAQILSLAFKVSPQHSALIYFLIADFMILFVLITYLYVRRLYFFTFHANLGRSNLPSNRHREVSLVKTFKKIWLNCVSLGLGFIVTASVYPSVTVLVESQHKGAGTDWNNVYFIPVVNYFLFSCGDYCGRMMSGFLLLPRKPYIIAIGSAMRIFVVPLLMLCNAQPRHSLPVLLHADWQFIGLIIIFAFSNGYLANITFINSARDVEDNEKEKSSAIMAANLGIGISIGAALSVMCVRVL